MKTWTRVLFVARCGGCGEVLGAGMAMQLWTFPNLKRKVIRCEACVGPAPPDLPALEPQQYHFTKRMSPLKKTAAEFIDDAREWMPFREPE
jgi:hypothetical protein